MERQLYKLREAIKANNITDITDPNQAARIWKNISSENHNGNQDESSKRDYDILTEEDFVDKSFFPKL
jgi:hypothetical protein